MRRLSGLDALFLAAESPRSPTQISCVSIVDPAENSPSVTVGMLKSALAARLHLLPPLRQRLVEVPFGIGRPYWIEDPDFDIGYHVHRAALPAPGGREELAALVADLAERRLDRRHPLWEWWFIEGLEHGYVANVWKIHHAYIDGVAGAAFQELLFDHEPNAAADPGPTEDWQPDAVPAAVPLIGRALRDSLGLPRQLARLGAALLPAVPSAAARSRPRFLAGDEDRPQPLSMRPPRLPFNAPITRRRTWAFTTVSLDEMKTVKNAFGVKINDVALAMVGGALRRYLQHHDALPDTPAVASVPVSVGAAGAGRAGNQLAGMSVSLATDVEDPVERLQAIYRSSQESKVLQQALGAETLMSLAELPPPALIWLATGFFAWSGLARRMPPMSNVMVSNVPGPRRPLYFLGGEVKAILSTGVLFDGAGLFVGLSSYRDQMDFGITACTDLVPDPWMLADGLDEELAGLVRRATD